MQLVEPPFPCPPYTIACSPQKKLFLAPSFKIPQVPSSWRDEVPVTMSYLWCWNTQNRIFETLLSTFCKRKVCPKQNQFNQNL